MIKSPLKTIDLLCISSCVYIIRNVLHVHVLCKGIPETDTSSHILTIHAIFFQIREAMTVTCICKCDLCIRISAENPRINILMNKIPCQKNL